MYLTSLSVPLCFLIVPFVSQIQHLRVSCIRTPPFEFPYTNAFRDFQLQFDVSLETKALRYNINFYYEMYHNFELQNVLSSLFCGYILFSDGRYFLSHLNCLVLLSLFSALFSDFSFPFFFPPLCCVCGWRGMNNSSFLLLHVGT